MKNKIDYEQIINELYEFIYFDDVDDEYMSIEQLVLAEKFCNIILDNFDFRNYCDNPNFKKKISREKAVLYSKNFLDILDAKYGNKLLENVNNEAMQFYEPDELDSAFVSYEGPKKEIGIPLKGDISDSIVITHEQIHDISMSDKNLSAAWSYFSETPSMLSELLQVDYMKENNFHKNEAKKYLAYATSGFIYRTLMLKFEIELLKAIHTSGHIDNYILSDLIFQIYNYCKDEYIAYNVVNDVIEKLLNPEDETFYFFDLRYVVGGLLASYLHSEIIKHPKLIKDFAGYNEYYKNLDIQGVFASIGLEMDEGVTLDLNEESYKKLEKSYKEELKRVW